MSRNTFLLELNLFGPELYSRLAVTSLKSFNFEGQRV